MSVAAISQSKDQTFSVWAASPRPDQGKIPSYLTPSRSSHVFRNQDESAWMEVEELKLAAGRLWEHCLPFSPPLANCIPGWRTNCSWIYTVIIQAGPYNHLEPQECRCACVDQAHNLRTHFSAPNEPNKHFEWLTEPHLKVDKLLIMRIFLLAFMTFDLGFSFALTNASLRSFQSR